MDVRLLELAARQHRCVSWRQLRALGYSRRAIQHRIDAGRFTVFDGVYVVAPLSDDRRTRWMAATLTAPDSVLSHASAGAAYGFRPFKAQFEVITRPGSGGPPRQGELLLMRTNRLEATIHQGIPITTPERTVIDLAPHLDDKALARAVREAVRLHTTTPSDLFVAFGRHRGRRGTRRLYATVSLYAGLPIHRTRSDAEARALQILHEAGFSTPAVNKRRNGEEADLSWPDRRHIVELDGPQFHLDAAAAAALP